jgi:hypothetical protein
LILMVLVAVVTPVEAVEMNAVFPELNLPGFKIVPFLTERGEYQTNLLLQRRGAIDDFISKTIPGVVVELPFGRHRLDLAMRAEIVRYLDHSQFDNEHFFLLGALKLDFPAGLSVRVRDEMAKTSDPPGTELTGRVNSFTNTLGPEVEYRLAQRFSVGVNYVWTHVDFESSVGALTRDEHLMGLSGFWRAFPKTDLFVNYSYGFKTFENDPSRDVTRHVAVVGVRGEVTSRLASTFRIGYESRTPDSRTGPAYNGLITGGDWVFTPSDRTRITLLTQRSAEESVFDTNRFFIATMATLLAQQRFGPKVTVNGRVFGGTNDYPDKSSDVTAAGRFHRRSDWLMGAGFGADYQIQRWLAVGGDYSLSLRESNFDTFDYTDHVLGVKVTLSF